jgi:hypothetical protein
VTLGVGLLDEGLELGARKQLESWLNMLENSRTRASRSVVGVHLPD